MAEDLRSRVERLVEEATADEALRLKLLHNAWLKAMGAVKDSPGEKALKDWKATEAELISEVERLEGKDAAPSPGSGPSWREFEDTKNRSEVWRRLCAMGYQVAERSFLRACAEGRCKTGVNGLYTARTCKAYAETLPRVGTDGVPAAENEENLQNQKLRIEVERGQLGKELEEIKLGRLKRALIDRDALNLELASRAVVLDSDFKQWFSAEAMELIVLAGGDTNKMAEFIDVVHGAWDRFIDKYATMDEFEVLWEEGEEEGTEA